MGNVILDGLLDQHITGSVTFYDLVYNNSSDLHLNNNVIVSDNLTMSGGNILPQGNMLTIGTGPITPGNIAYTSGTVLGKLERWVNLTATPYLFPIGNVNDYRPAILTFNNLSSGSLIMEFLDGDPGASGLPVSEDGVNVIQAFTEGHWDALPDNSLSSDSYNIQLTATNFTSNAIIPGTRILKRISGGDWTLEGMHMAAVPPDLYRNGLDQGIDASGIQFGVGHVLCSGLSIDRIISDVSCNGDNDGAIDITVNGGTAPYTFSWSHGPDTEDVSALFAGDYTVGVSDNSGCTIDSTFTVTEPLQLSANLNSLPVSCAGGNDGSITISAPVGGSGSYEYSIDGGTSWFATGSFNNLTTAVYNVQMRDALAPACILILNAALDLTTPDDLIPPTAICRDITAPLDISGNVTITTLDVDNGSNDNCGIASMSLDVASFTCADIGNNTVTLTVLDASGNSDFCSSTVTVLDNIAPVISDCPANITVQADTSYCGTTVTWSEPTATDNCPGLVLISTHNPGDFFPVGTTTVSYTATDASGLTDVCSFDIIVEAPVSPVINGPTSVCTPSRESYMAIDPGSHSFLWTVTNGTISGSNNDSIVEVDWTGAVQGSVELTISSGTGCSVSASSTVDKSLTPTVGNINSSSSLIRR